MEEEIAKHLDFIQDQLSRLSFDQDERKYEDGRPLPYWIVLGEKIRDELGRIADALEAANARKERVHHG